MFRIVCQQVGDSLLYLAFYPVRHGRLDDFKRIVLGIQIIQARIELEDIAQQIVDAVGFLIFTGIGNIIDPGPAQIAALSPADELQVKL